MSRLVLFNAFMFKVMSTLPVLIGAIIASVILMNIWSNPYYIDFNFIAVGVVWGIALGRKFSTVIK